MGRSEEFHNGVHTLEHSEKHDYAGTPGRTVHDAYCPKCNTTFAAHPSPDSAIAAHKRYVGTPEEAQSRNDRRAANDLVLQERYGDTVIGPREVMDAYAKRNPKR